MDSNDIYKSLCQELDFLLLDVLEDMEKYVRSQLELERTMKQGHVNIAKTRYINGSSSVASLKLPTELSSPMEPQVTLFRTTEQHGPQINVINTLTNPTSTEKGVRKRKGDGEEGSEASSEGKPIPTPRDPIRLFGVLVPQSLKLAQKSFITAVEQAAICTEIQCELEEKRARYLKLLNVKHALRQINEE